MRRRPGQERGSRGEGRHPRPHAGGTREWGATAFREDADPPSFVVYITDHAELKLQAIGAYESQFQGLTQAGDVYPGGDRALPDRIRAGLARYGSMIRVAFGEPFRALETMAWPTLGRLDVATF